MTDDTMIYKMSRIYPAVFVTEETAIEVSQPKQPFQAFDRKKAKGKESQNNLHYIPWMVNNKFLYTLALCANNIAKVWLNHGEPVHLVCWKFQFRRKEERKICSVWRFWVNLGVSSYILSRPI